MPYCVVPPRPSRKRGAVSDSSSDPVNIFYQTYGQGDCKIIMIMGVAATNLAWWPQIKPLTGTDVPNEADDVEKLPEVPSSTIEHVQTDSSSEELALRPAAESGSSPGGSFTSSEDSKESVRAKSDLGHRLMVNGAEALASSALPTLTRVGSDEDDACSRPPAADAMQAPHVFERLDSENGPSGMPEYQNGTGGGQGSADKGMLTGRMVCVFDNRGVGKSSCPKDPKNYRTEIMARDALAIADELGWKRFHVIGHSMGGMIACKLAAISPLRVKSLAVISTSTGGFDLFPRMELRPFRLLARMIQAKTPEDRASVDLDTHFSDTFLSELVDGLPRRSHLHKEYVRTLSTKGALQPKHAQSGQLSACWNHDLTREDIHHIAEANVPTSVIHGSDDVVAHISLGRRVARKFHGIARFVELYGGHMIIRERVEEVNTSLIELVTAAESGVRGAAWAASDKRKVDEDFALETSRAMSCGRLVAC